MTESTRRKSGGGGRGTILFLAFLGLSYVLLALSSSLRSRLDERIGVETSLALAIGFVFFYLASFVLERNRFRGEVRDLLEQLLEGVYGKNYRQQREAIDILVKAVGSQDKNARTIAVEQLLRMTGQNFGEDFEQWSQWWGAHRRTFRSTPLPNPADGQRRNSSTT